MFTVETLREFEGAPVWGTDNEQIGHVGEIWYDEESHEARWLKVGRGLLGLRTVFVPLSGADVRGDGVHVPYTAAQLESSPEVPDEAELDEEAEGRLATHYGADEAESEASVTRSEEELQVGKRPVKAGRARLRKWVETEPVAEEVELRRETARIEREPVDEVVEGAEIQEQEVEVPLLAEEAVVDKQTVAKERIGLEKDVEIERERVSDELKRERVEVEGDVDRR